MSGIIFVPVTRERLGTPVAYYPTSAILSATEFRQFWVTWDDKQLAVGYGPLPGVDIILSWTDDQYTAVQYLSISTWEDVPGQWEFTSYPGKSCVPGALYKTVYI